MKLVNNKLIIARILYGGLIHRQGLLQVGDRIVEVNQELVDSMNPSDLQALLVSHLYCTNESTAGADASVEVPKLHNIKLAFIHTLIIIMMNIFNFACMQNHREIQRVGID